MGTMKFSLFIKVFVTGSSILVQTTSGVITVPSPLVLVPEIPGFAMPTLILFREEPVIHWHWGIFESGSKLIFVSDEW